MTVGGGKHGGWRWAAAARHEMPPMRPHIFDCNVWHMSTCPHIMCTHSRDKLAPRDTSESKKLLGLMHMGRPERDFLLALAMRINPYWELFGFAEFPVEGNITMMSDSG